MLLNFFNYALRIVCYAHIMLIHNIIHEHTWPIRPELSCQMRISPVPDVDIDSQASSSCSIIDKPKSQTKSVSQSFARFTIINMLLTMPA